MPASPCRSITSSAPCARRPRAAWRSVRISSRRLARPVSWSVNDSWCSVRSRCRRSPTSRTCTTSAPTSGSARWSLTVDSVSRQTPCPSRSRAGTSGAAGRRRLAGAPTWVSTAGTSATSSGWISSGNGRPTTSASESPKRRAAAGDCQRTDEVVVEHHGQVGGAGDQRAEVRLLRGEAARVPPQVDAGEDLPDDERRDQAIR